MQSIYAAFGRGDIPAILDCLADDVAWEHWESHWGQRGGVPWLTRRTGKAGAKAFFEVIAGLQFREFAVKGLMAGDRQVAAEIVVEIAEPGGGVLRDEEMHLWNFNEEGKVSRFRHYADTAKHIAASRGEDTRALASGQAV